MKCQLCGVNDARYITSSNALTCAICPIQHELDSIRMSNVPALLQVVRDYLLIAECKGGRDGWADQFREIVGKNIGERRTP
jgi:hypothetical protein